MLRALGLKSSYIILIVIIEAAIFSIPAMIVAFIIGYLLNVLICVIIFTKSSLAQSYFIHKMGFIYGIFMGIITPLISNILPIRSALSKSLRDGLNILRRTVNPISITVIKLKNVGISFSKLTLALTLISCGLIAYYAIPLSIFSKNYEIFSFLMSLIFMAMIIGMIILSTFITPYIERLVLYLIFLIFARDYTLRNIVITNLEGHKKRNLKTSLMYSIALCFLIMTGSNISQQKELFSSVSKLVLAAALVIMTPPGVGSGLEESELRNYLHEVQRTKGLIKGFTFISKSLGDATFIHGRNALLGPLAGYPMTAIYTYAVEKNYMQVANTEYYYPKTIDTDINMETLSNGKIDAVSSLFSDEGVENNYDTFDTHKILNPADKYRNTTVPRIFILNIRDM